MALGALLGLPETLKAVAVASRTEVVLEEEPSWALVDTLALEVNGKRRVRSLVAGPADVRLALWAGHAWVVAGCGHDQPVVLEVHKEPLACLSQDSK